MHWQDCSIEDTKREKTPIFARNIYVASYYKKVQISMPICATPNVFRLVFMYLGKDGDKGGLFKENYKYVLHL